MATYQSTKPAAADQLNQSQADIQQNFLAIEDFVTVDHVDFAGGAGDEGKHAKTTFPEQGADPTPGANEANIYAKASALGDAGTALFFRKESSGDIINFTSSTQNANGWSRLPSGILLKWGSGTISGSGAISYPVAATVPVFTAVYSVQLTPYDAAAVTDSDAAVALTAFDTTTITVYSSTRSTASTAQSNTFQYLAIGI